MDSEIKSQTHLIHHYHLGPLHFCHTLLDQVQYPAWCSNHYMHYQERRRYKQHISNIMLMLNCGQHVFVDHINT